MRQPSKLAVAIPAQPSERRAHPVAAATDTSALGVLDAARESGREADFAIAVRTASPSAGRDRPAPARSSAPSRTKSNPTAKAYPTGHSLLPATRAAV